ncbi:MAG: tol-pal system-associated acyl-CoA thioesterase [Halofilum sp. (in: g-proteobacteria)]|nr:tol-pal system-associated acyl-CoA thioesterase [Halofilum sp. (in: g-proteobacteria)]
MTGAGPIEDGACFRMPVRVYYEDTDAGGVVYYANYLKYLERARTEWLRAAGWGQTALVSDRSLLFAVRSIELDYHAPARLDDALEVEARIAGLGRARIDFAQRVLRDGEALCIGRVRIACLDAGTFRPRALPDDMKEVFAGVD